MPSYWSWSNIFDFLKWWTSVSFIIMLITKTLKNNNNKNNLKDSCFFPTTDKIRPSYFYFESEAVPFPVVSRLTSRGSIRFCFHECPWNKPGNFGLFCACVGFHSSAAWTTQLFWIYPTSNTHHALIYLRSLHIIFFFFFFLQVVIMTIIIIIYGNKIYIAHCRHHEP